MWLLRNFEQHSCVLAGLRFNQTRILLYVGKPLRFCFLYRAVLALFYNDMLISFKEREEIPI